MVGNWSLTTNEKIQWIPLAVSAAWHSTCFEESTLFNFSIEEKGPDINSSSSSIDLSYCLWLCLCMCVNECNSIRCECVVPEQEHSIYTGSIWYMGCCIVCVYVCASWVSLFLRFSFCGSFVVLYLICARMLTLGKCTTSSAWHHFMEKWYLNVRKIYLRVDALRYHLLRGFFLWSSRTVWLIWSACVHSMKCIWRFVCELWRYKQSLKLEPATPRLQELQKFSFQVRNANRVIINNNNDCVSPQSHEFLE